MGRGHETARKRRVRERKALAEEKEKAFKIFNESVRQHVDEFESTMMTLKMNHCNCCQQVKIGMSVNSSGRCNKCARSGMTAEKWIDEFMLPVWFDEKGDPHYELPSELCDLEIGEKMLIQQLAPFVPLWHIWRDYVGIKGHVCSFPQRIEEVMSCHVFLKK